MLHINKYKILSIGILKQTTKVIKVINSIQLDFDLY